MNRGTTHPLTNAHTDSAKYATSKAIAGGARNCSGSIGGMVYLSSLPVRYIHSQTTAGTANIIKAITNSQRLIGDATGIAAHPKSLFKPRNPRMVEPIAPVEATISLSLIAPDTRFVFSAYLLALLRT